jgi:hypothetical protein
VPLEQVVGLGLALAELHGVGELSLGLLVGPLPLAPPHRQVEGPSELGHLVAAAGREPLAELTVGDLAGEPGVGAQARHQVADQGQGDEQADQHRAAAEQADAQPGGAVGRLGPGPGPSRLGGLGGRHLGGQLRGRLEDGRHPGGRPAPGAGVPAGQRARPPQRLEVGQRGRHPLDRGPLLGRVGGVDLAQRHEG